jgi:histone-lysine N-methyltransferase SETMAR
MDNFQQKYRNIIQFLREKGESPAQIHRELQTIYGDKTPSYSTVTRWYNRFENGDYSVKDKPRSGRPKSSIIDRNIAKVSKLIEQDRRLTVREISQKLTLSITIVWRILTFVLGLVLLSARWIPKLLTPEQKKSRKNACEENLFLNSLDSDFFQGQIVTGDETYIHYYDPTTKRESSQWLPKGSRPPLKAIKKSSCKKRMALIFWDRVGVLMIYYFKKGATLTGKLYCKLLAKLKSAIIRKRGDMWEDGVFLLHDNAPSHTSNIAQAAISDLGFTQLTHPPYSPDLAPSDYFLFSKLKEFLRKKTFKNDNQLENTTNRWLQRKPPSFYNEGISALPHRWNKCVNLGGDYVEK